MLPTATPAGRLEADLGQGPVEELPVLGLLDGLHRRPEHPRPGAGEGPGPPQGETAVEGGLAAERHDDAVRPLPLDDPVDEIRRHGQEVDAVGQRFGGLDGRDVRVDEDDLEALLLEGLDGLAPGVVEFSGLADLQGAAPEDEDLPGGRRRGTGGLGGLSRLRPARGHGRASRKRSKRNAVSVGPGQASGWNWTPAKGFRPWRTPSFVPSLAFVNQGRQPRGSVRVSTA